MLYRILISCLVSSTLAATLEMAIGTKRLQKISRPLSLIATGLLITLSFTHILPEAMEGDADLHTIGLCAWFTIMILIASEMFLNSLHNHHHNTKLTTKALAQGGSGLLSGTALHTFCDGIMIASSYMVDTSLGLAVTVAIMTHEIPQELGDYAILLECGMTRKEAFSINAVAGLATASGGLLGYFILDRVENLLPYALAISASSFIYVALSDLLPRLNKADSKKIMLKRFIFLLIGALLAMVISHHHV